MYPPGIVTRTCTVGGGTALESGESLVLSVVVASSRGLIWAATGWRLPSLPRTVAASVGDEVAFELPVTSQAGYRSDSSPGTIIDVSAPGSYSHTYTATVTINTPTGGLVSKHVIGPFPLPAEDLSPVDLGTMLPVGTVAGGAVLVPATWDAKVAAAEAAAELASRGAIFEAERYKQGRTDLEAIHAACAAATAVGPGNMVRLSGRTWDVGAGLSMAGYTCGLVGVGASRKIGAPGMHRGSVLRALIQSGPVLDLTGWSGPDDFIGMVEFGHFLILGSFVADPTKGNVGIRGASLGGVHLHDIAIVGTGGPGIDLYRLYLGHIDRVSVLTPVSATLNDVPYAIFRGCNGSRISGLLCRGFHSGNPNVGVSGAVIVTDDETYSSGGCTLSGVSFEGMSVPAGGTLVSNRANNYVWRDTYFVDIVPAGDPTGTSYFTLLPPTIVGEDWGGNQVIGLIPDGHSLGTGVKVLQSRNSIHGTRGYLGRNVTLGPGVGYSTVLFTGSHMAASGAGVIDNSGNSTNTVVDYPMLAASGAVGAKAYSDASQTVASWTAAMLVLNRETSDPYGFHSLTGNTSRLTIPPGMGGTYLVSASLTFQANVTGTRSVIITVNGITVAENVVAGSAGGRVWVTEFVKVVAGDYVEVRIWQESGVDLTVNGTASLYRV